LIEGVKVLPLKKHVDDRGFVMEILRCDDAHFVKFGQVYLSTCEPSPHLAVVKGWHRHKGQWDSFCVVKGKAKVGLYDDREGSATRGESQAVILGEDDPCLLQIPPGVWHGQMALGFEPSYLINISSELYNQEEPDEQRAPLEAFPFEWEVRSR
jgi:dTDP-4-dehydrorhamnose 3,5-epimerase